MTNITAELEQAISLSIASNTEFKEKLVQIKSQSSYFSRSAEKVSELLRFFSTTAQPQEPLQELQVKEEKKTLFKDIAKKTNINKALLTAVLLGMLPLILPKEAIEKISDFVEGLIGNDSVEKLKKFNTSVKSIIHTVGIVSATIAGSFIAVKLFKTVANTIELIRQLAILTGLVSVMSGDEQDAIDNQRRRIEDHDRRIQQHYQRIARERARLNQARISHAQAVNAHRQNVIKAERANLDEQRRLQAQDADNRKRAAELEARDRESRLREQRSLAQNDARIQAERERAVAQERASRAQRVDQDRGATDAQRAETQRAINSERARIEQEYRTRVAEVNQQHAQRMSDLEDQNRARIQDIERTRVEQERTMQTRSAELDSRQTVLEERSRALNERQQKINQDIAQLDEARNQFDERVAADQSRRAKAKAAIASITSLGVAGVAARLGSASLKAIAFLAWPLVETMFGTIQDLFNEDIREKESFTEIFLKNFASALSFGFLNRDNIDNTIKVLQGDKETIERNLKAIEGLSVSQGEFAVEQDVETRMLTDERFRKQQEKVAKELEDRRLSEEQRQVYLDELKAVTDAQRELKKEQERKAAQDAARQRMIDDERRLLEEERAKISKEAADLVTRLNEEQRIRAQAAVPSDYRTAAEKADILRVTRGSIYTESNKPVKDWLNNFFKRNNDGKILDDKSYENAERKRLLRIGSVQTTVVNNTVLVNQGAK